MQRHALERQKFSLLVIKGDHSRELNDGGGWFWSIFTCGGGHQSIHREVVELFSDRIETSTRGSFKFCSQSKCFRTGRDFSSLPNHISAKLCTVPGSKFVVLFHASTYVIFGSSNTSNVGKFTDAIKGVLYLRKSLKRLSQKLQWRSNSKPLPGYCFLHARLSSKWTGTLWKQL